jgi:hypothetical protein
LAIEPSGRFLYAANGGSNDLSGFALHPQSGVPAPGPGALTGILPSSVVAIGMLD